MTGLLLIVTTFTAAFVAVVATCQHIIDRLLGK